MDSKFKSLSIQKVFNETKGVIKELNRGIEFCSITIQVGHSNKRMVNFTCKKNTFECIIKNINIDDKVNIRFFPTSTFKHNRWYSSNNILQVIKL